MSLSSKPPKKISPGAVQYPQVEGVDCHIILFITWALSSSLAVNVPCPLGHRPILCNHQILKLRLATDTHRSHSGVQLPLYDVVDIRL
ncbi:hypothetical protein L3X38_041131 [Prunus dulcis]|uniref:Uncharacterized protein n=1 Tax=Prunus dulcis TaxID=3755 RepID=A0AAD4USN3_PRUDU|nr:hypothetical protein L3X38_041131 [Prunus dulcis]